LNPLPINGKEKMCRHIDALFGTGVSDALPENIEFEFSRRTGRMKNFRLGGGNLVGTLRTDGGIALTIAGAQLFLNNSKQFYENCVVPAQEAVPFVSEGRSLFCKHVEWCGSNIKVCSDATIIDNNKVIAVGVSILASGVMKRYAKGVAVKVRQGIKGRTD
jgi:uncharacterized protein with predicted RNA binding PUA domain